jgi:hypothetical protein
MMKRVVAVAVLLAALMFGIKDHGLLQRAGLAGSCTTVAAPRGDERDWRRCTSGKLSGTPDLTRQSCTRAGAVAKVEYWTCPAGVDSGPSGR